MPYTPNTPQPGEIPAQSQALILQNFQYLNSIVQGNANALLLNRQGSAPTVAATQVGIYNLLSGGVSSLMVKNGAAVAIDILKAGLTATGWYQLPCGIILKWATSPLLTAHNDYTLNLSTAPAPKINTLLMISLTAGPGTDTSPTMTYKSFTSATQVVSYHYSSGNHENSTCNCLVIGV